MLLQLIVFCILVHLGKSNGESFEILENLFGIKEPTERNPRATNPDWGTFSVKLDHHNPFDTRTFEMRYLNNSEFFQEGGPIFIFLGGEWTISESYLMTGQMYDMAEEHNGYMFYTEHRYYGESFPTEDYSSENLKYLIIDQALEDVANFITYQKSLDMFKDSKVVVVGGSYSATMATWLRLKYPHLVDIAYSSSAPLLAKADFYEYLEVVNDAINGTDPECLSIVESGIQDILEYLETSDGREYILETFNLCDQDTDLNDTLEKSYFFGNIIWSWSGIVQYATDGVIEYYCNVIHEADGTSVEKLAAFVQSYSGYCLSSYTDFVEYYGSTNLTTGAGRQWYYQTCTEYGFYQTTNSDKQPFNNTLPLEYFHRWCYDLFGSNFTSDILDTGINRTNLLYGHLEPEITKVVSVHGTIDPWHRLGVLEDVNELAPTIVVTGASHCNDLRSANAATDSSEMYAAKTRVKELIAEWLGKNSSDTESTEAPTESTEATTESTATGGITTDSTSTTEGSHSGLTLESSVVTLFTVLITVFILK